LIISIVVNVELGVEVKDCKLSIKVCNYTACSFQLITVVIF